jgi:hypothetical protein
MLHSGPARSFISSRQIQSALGGLSLAKRRQRVSLTDHTVSRSLGDKTISVARPSRLEMFHSGPARSSISSRQMLSGSRHRIDLDLGGLVLANGNKESRRTDHIASRETVWSSSRLWMGLFTGLAISSRGIQSGSRLYGHPLSTRQVIVNHERNQNPQKFPLSKVSAFATSTRKKVAFFWRCWILPSL